LVKRRVGGGVAGVAGGGVGSLAAWAARDLRRHPAEALLSGLALFALVALTATLLLLVQAWSSTVERVLAGGPALVVRQVSAGGWQPLPVDVAMAAARGVVGVTAVAPRIWGVVSGPGGVALTVVGVDAKRAVRLAALGLEPPVPGEAVVGPGVELEGVGQESDATSDAAGGGGGDEVAVQGEIVLRGQQQRQFWVRRRLPTGAALTLHDLVLLTAEDARGLLGLPMGAASDLALGVFHPAEEQAILADLAAAFPFPVRITTRGDAVGAAVADLSRDGGLALMLYLPALLAMALLVAAVVRGGLGAVAEIGLYKALGWSTGDLVRLHLLKSIGVGLPATLLGLSVAVLLVYWPGVTWPGALLLGWRGAAPMLTLDLGDAATVLLSVAAWVLAPWLLAALAPAIRGALADPADLLRGSGL
jgi:hypothetical protein